MADGESDGRSRQAIPEDEFVRGPLDESSEASDDSELEDDDDDDDADADGENEDDEDEGGGI